METQERRRCKCCDKIMSGSEIRRDDTLYCKSCKKHHKNLYAKWRMQEKRGEYKKRRLSNRIKKEGIDKDIAEETKKNMSDLFEKERVERRTERIIDNQKQSSDSSPIYYPPSTRSILNIIIDFFRRKKN